MLVLGLALLFAAGGAVAAPHSEDGLVWTVMPDPDPHFVPPPPDPQPRAARTPRHIRVAPRADWPEVDEVRARALRDADRLEQVVANTCRSVREAGIDAPACKGH